jgi:hypothetical protein
MNIIHDNQFIDKNASNGMCIIEDYQRLEIV